MIAFNNIPATIRTPGVYGEIDNARALTGLLQNPHKALIIGQKLQDLLSGAFEMAFSPAFFIASKPLGTVPLETLVAITKDNLADGYFGTGSV